MARKAVIEGGKKDELVKAALKLFLENGYENTSVRMILNEVQGEVGMFYHYFKSKEKIFDDAIRLFFQEYTRETSEILAGSENDIWQDLNSVLAHLEKTINKYNKLDNGQLHWSMKISLNQLTVKSLVPFAAARITQLRSDGRINPVFDISDQELASFLVFGIHGILHEKPFSQLNQDDMIQKKATIFHLVSSILGIEAKEGCQ